MKIDVKINFLKYTIVKYYLKFANTRPEKNDNTYFLTNKRKYFDTYKTLLDIF